LIRRFIYLFIYLFADNNNHAVATKQNSKPINVCTAENLQWAWSSGLTRDLRQL